MSCEQILMPGTVRSVNSIGPDEYGNVNVGLLAYPIGAIYMSTVATSPAELFGGTWEALDEGRVLLGAGSSYAAGTTGGSSSRNISVNNLPRHSHTVTQTDDGLHYHGINTYKTVKAGQDHEIAIFDASPADDFRENLGWERYTTVPVNSTATTAQRGGHTHTLRAGNTGDGTAFNVMQPYLSVYMWKRTA